MDRALALKAKQLARGTQPIEILGYPESETLDVVDADFVDVPDAPPSDVMLVLAAHVQISPGRVRRATDAYVAEPVVPRPVLVIA
jgi:hypothetical protein